jgi:hypothetical protein
MPETAMPVEKISPAGIVELSPVETAVPVEDPTEKYKLDPSFGKEHNLWAAAKVLESLIPLARPLGLLTKSGQEEFKAQSGGMKALELGIDLVSLLPAALVSKGFRAAARELGASRLTPGIGRMFKNEPLPLETMDKIRGKITPFVDEDQANMLMRKHGLNQEEIEAWKAGALRDHLLIGGMERSFGLNKILDWDLWRSSREARFTKDVEGELKLLARPREVREYEHYRKLYDKAVKDVLGEAFISKDMREKTAKFIYQELYGAEAAKILDLAEMNADQFANIVYRMLDRRVVGQLQAKTKLGAGSVWPAKMQPTRIIFGLGDELFGTKAIYDEGVAGYRQSMEFALNAVGDFQQIVAEKGLGKVSRDIANHIKFKFTGSKNDYHLAGAALVERYNLARGGADHKELLAQYLRQPEGVRKLMDSWEQWSDQLYIEHLRGRTNRVMEMAGLKPEGQRELANLLEGGIIPTLERAFAPAEAVNMSMKNLIVNGELNKLREFAARATAKEWINKESAGLVETAFSAFKKDEKGRLVGFPGYFDDITSAIYARRKRDDGFIARVLAKPELAKFYQSAKGGFLVGEATPDLSLMIERRARAQGLDRFFYPAAKRIAEMAKTIPDDYKAYTAHWLFRMLGKPSPVDRTLAAWLQSSVGGAERLLNLKSGGLWNEGRVNDLAHNVNNLVYMGGLGFKPFSALRNFFQLPINVPGDLGGAKDLLWMVKGIANAAKKETRAEINAMGLIEEYAPELHTRAAAIAAGKRLTIAGKTLDLPDLQQARDTAMFMFKLSDRWIRYATAGTAMAKWDHYLAKFFNPTTGALDPKFLAKMNISGRNKWVANDIENLLKTGGADNIRKAREIFTKDVVADTQYLYGVHESPILSHTTGAAGKMALVFQSWWMNYGTMLEKWMRTGDTGLKAHRLFGFMLSCAIAEQLMEGVWGRGTAVRTIGFGPFPGEISEFAIPPAYAPIYNGMGSIISAGQLNPEGVERHLKNLWRATSMFVPGGLQLQSSWKGATEEGFPGFMKSIIRYKPQENYEPLWGLFHK